MSDKNNNIILLYDGVKKSINIPESISDLEAAFLKEFNEDKTDKNFIYSYSDEDDENVFIDEINYSESIEFVKKKSEPIIEVQIDRQSKLEIPNTNEEKNNTETNKEEVKEEEKDNIDLSPSISMSIRNDITENVEEKDKSLDPLTSGTIFKKEKKKDEDDNQNQELDPLTSGTIFKKKEKKEVDDNQNQELDPLTSGTIFKKKEKKDQDIIIEENEKNESNSLNKKEEGNGNNKEIGMKTPGLDSSSSSEGEKGVNIYKNLDMTKTDSIIEKDILKKKLETIEEDNKKLIESNKNMEKKNLELQKKFEDEKNEKESIIKKMDEQSNNTISFKNELENQ